MFRSTLVLALFAYLSLLGKSLADLENQLVDICDDLVKQDKCRTDPELMIKYCEKACVKWQEGISKIEMERLPESDGTFFEFSAKSAAGDLLNFERFEGYWTMVVNVALACDPQRDLEEGLKIFQRIQETWPYILEIVLFPFRHPGIDYEKVNCEKDMAALQKKGRKIHLMQAVKLNGKDTDPIYIFLKKPFKIVNLDTDLATYFFVNPDGDQIIAHHGASLDQIKRYLSEQLQQEL